MAVNPKVILVTGCSEGGIGFALCEAYAAQGCIVYATARRPESMTNLTHPMIHKLKLDVIEDDQVSDVIRSIIDREGRIDILVNNAGMGIPGPLLDVSMDNIRLGFEVHTFAVLRLCGAVAPHMAKRKTGTIVTIGSIAGLFPIPWHGTYSAAKAATHSVMDSLWMECQPLGIKTTLIAAGHIESKLLANAQRHFHIPENTLYPAFISKEIFEGLTVGRETWTHVMPTDEFAKKVAKETVKRNPPRYMCIGGQSVWYTIYLWLPRVLVLTLLWRAMGG